MGMVKVLYRQSARDLGNHRQRVHRYSAWAVEQVLPEEPSPSSGGLHQLLEQMVKSPDLYCPNERSSALNYVLSNKPYAVRKCRE